MNTCRKGVAAALNIGHVDARRGMPPKSLCISRVEGSYGTDLGTEPGIHPQRHDPELKDRMKVSESVRSN